MFCFFLFYNLSQHTCHVCCSQNVVENPSGALVKAVLMNGAQFMRGVDNGVDGVTEIKPYDFNQGFGRLALQCKFLFIHPPFVPTHFAWPVFS